MTTCPKCGHLNHKSKMHQDICTVYVSEHGAECGCSHPQVRPGGEMNEQPKMECPNCANPPHEGPCRRKRVAEPLAPLSDERVRELTQLTRNGPDVVAMAQEAMRSRERIAALEAENARLQHRIDDAEEMARYRWKSRVSESPYPGGFLSVYDSLLHDANGRLRDIALALGLPVDAEPDAVLAAAKDAAKDRERQEWRERLVASYPNLELENDGFSPLTRATTDAAMTEHPRAAERSRR